MENTTIDFDFFDNNINIKRYYTAKAKGLIKGMNVEIVKGKRYKVFTPQLFAILTCKDLPIGNTKFDGFTLIKDYVEGFEDGIKYFEREYRVSLDTIINKTKEYTNTLHICFYHKAPNEDKGWNYWINNYPASVNRATIKDFGFYAGVIDSLDKLKNKYPDQFKDFDTCPEQSENVSHRETILAYNFKVQAGLEKEKIANDWKRERGDKAYQQYYTVSYGKKNKPATAKELKKVIELLSEYPSAQKLAINKLSELESL